MRFNYYRRLSAKNKQIYDRSDAIVRTELRDAAALWPLMTVLESALAADDRLRVEEAARETAWGLLGQLGAPAVKLKVLAVRPSNAYGELHGLYEGVEGRLKTAKITLWMRTAKKKRAVAFKSFLRTLLHELGHHLDFEHFRLGDSFHTEGFYKRESSLFYQLLPEARKPEEKNPA